MEKESRFYEPFSEDSVRCTICPRMCVVKEGERGFCGTKENRDGRLVALELNPYPQFTFYESRSGQPITRAVVDHLIHNQITDSNVFA